MTIEIRLTPAEVAKIIEDRVPGPWRLELSEGDRQRVANGEDVFGPGAHCPLEDALLQSSLAPYGYQRAAYDEDVDGQTFGSRYAPTAGAVPYDLPSFLFPVA